MAHLRIGVLLCAAFLTLALPLNAREGLSMRVRPTVAMAPATVRIMVTLENHAENRWLEVVAESEDFFRSSQIQLDGTNAPRVSVFEFKELPPGVYQVSGRLTRADGQQFAVSNSLKIAYGAGSAR